MNKKWTAGLLISLLVVAGCGGSGDKKTENKPQAITLLPVSLIRPWVTAFGIRIFFTVIF